MQFINFIKEHEALINIIINLLVAFGTIATVMVALHLGYKDTHPKLKTRGLMSVLLPENSEFLHIWCVNEGKQPVIVKSFSFKPNRMKKSSQRLMIFDSVPSLSTKLPKMLAYSDDANVYFSAKLLQAPQFKDFLGPYKWLAKLKLKFLWRIVAITNVGEFEGEIYDSLIKKILSSQYNT